jgi:hypothetical protein
MEWLKQIWEQLSQLFKWWIIILPWESGLRIWLGKRVTLLKPGFYFRVPYLHSCYIQPVRLDFLNLHPQTLTAKSGETITISVIIGYSIHNVFDLYNSVSAINSALAGNVMGQISKHINTHDLADCNPSRIEESIKNNIEKLNWGLSIKEVSVVSYAIVKTFRLIQDQHWLDRGMDLNKKV